MGKLLGQKFWRMLGKLMVMSVSEMKEMMLRQPTSLVINHGNYS